MSRHFQHTELPKKRKKTKRKSLAVVRNKARRSARQVMLAKFDMTPRDYDVLLHKQGGVCALCGEAETRRDRRTGQLTSLAVDHCHETGRVRGLLCMACNTGLGLLGDTAEAVGKAFFYLCEP